ncbi:phage integrase SAM-like domain-containing protein [Myroides sp. JBRI-B21084]|uniref:phage integrase SAM-like domain-containing protein n=1 Tax=Myroides sp. JBRI-B21084 TaxID=3119977 RepID=UPI0026E3242F|nr:phage integrase SAM-like domain-containing protein [Paenimyroides cloacae]WKW47296.1 phage integrase SAM-like domain-containing protein [Paenimyroides cloacae]
MKIVIKLNKSNGDRGNGYELVIYCNHLRERKQKLIGFSKLEHFNEEMQLINEKHPDYEDLLPRLMDLKLKARKIIAKGCTNVNEAMTFLFDEDADQISFIKFCEDHINEDLQAVAEAEKRGDLVLRNRIKGNVNSNQNTLNQFKKFYPNIKFTELDYNKIMLFRKRYENAGASRRTIQHYLAHLKAMYNKGIRKYNLEDQKPFQNAMDNLKVKSFDSVKKYLDITDIALFEKYQTPLDARRRYMDLFLLQFYFGGCDLTDLYFLKKTALFKDRIIIQRSKTEQITNLKIHPKAKIIIDKYKATSGEWLFNWGKSSQEYRTFTHIYRVSLQAMQKDLGIKVQPTGGNLGIKVARHTFGNRAKQLMIETDIIRELMGHVRDDIDNFYKDKFSEKVRDEALFKIIDTDGI